MRAKHIFLISIFLVLVFGMVYLAFNANAIIDSIDRRINDIYEELSNLTREDTVRIMLLKAEVSCLSFLSYLVSPFRF